MKGHWTHGKTNTRVYQIWCGMKSRCLCPSVRMWHKYGGRGITICDRWVNSFENFLSDMGNPPTPKHTLERIMVDKDYAPGNCKWATQKEQQNNRTNNIRITFLGRTQTLSEWVDEFGQKYERVYRRYKISGWNFEDALTKPMGYCP